ncbi:MAG: PAS domain S-box protein [Deltaproteobacteria bacterium]|nr:PAS domain S-box protein [Candidatus Zymogenaceae bacterium]
MQGSNTILIADDDRGIRDTLAFLLVDPGYRLLFTDNGKDTVETALAHTPDLVLLDVMMPEMDGFEVCRRLRSDPRTTELPILIVTALDDHRSRLAGIEAGADDFISKPFDPEELEARVKSIIRLNRYRKLVSERMKFERLFDLSPDGIIIVDSRGNIASANPALFRMIGAGDGGGWIGRSLTSLAAPDNKESLRDSLDDASTESCRPLVETVFIRHDGSRFPVEMSVGGGRYEGEPALYFIVRDITDRKRFEETLVESEKKYRDLVDNIEDIMYVMDGHGTFLFVNEAMEQSFGYAKSQIIGRKFLEFLVPEDYSLAESLFKEQLTGNEVGTFELSFVNNIGKKITLELRERLIWDGPTIIEVHGIGRDITERKRIQQELQKSEEKFGNLFKTSKDVIFICDNGGRFVDVNPAGEYLLKYTKEELLALNFGDVCADRRDPDRLNEVMADSGFVQDFDLTLRAKDRATMDCLITATRTNDPGGDGVGFQGIIKDITERKRFVDLTLDGIDDGVFTVDSQLRITYINSAAEEILSISREKSIGGNCCDIVHSGTCDDDCVLKKFMESNEEIIQKRTSLTGAGGRKIPVSLLAAVLRNREGVTGGGVVIFRDLSAIEALKKEIDSNYTYEDIISKNHRIREIFSILPDISESGSTVLIEGPSGTGKELFARAIHNLSPRKNGPFIAVNCSAIPETLLESELFGYVKGAFTNALADKPGRFALAEGGTLFLDEIVELSKPLQVKLLRVLEEREYEPLGAVASVKTDARIIASSNRSITREVKAGVFREDLFYRLNVLKISLPQLKERREDIPLLIDHFLKKFAGSMGKNISAVSEEVLEFLMTYDFPGNVRELENIIEHASVLCRRDIVTMEHLPRELIGSAKTPRPTTELKDHVMDSEKELIRTILARHSGDRAKAARALNIGRTSLWRKMKKYHLL